MADAQPRLIPGAWSRRLERLAMPINMAAYNRGGLMLLGLIMLAGAAQAEPDGMQKTLKRGGEIVTQPIQDVGARKIEIPPILDQAQDDPYSLDGMRTCTQIRRETAALTEALGPDFAVGGKKRENKAGRLAEAGGKTIVNAIIPFRGLVREISGAGPAQRRLNKAIDAGFARRGFLRGVALGRRCAGAGS